jgi:hypothetical protein
MNALKRLFSALRVWLGWGDMSEERLSPPHGWLLPDPAIRREPAIATGALGATPVQGRLASRW